MLLSTLKNCIADFTALLYPDLCAACAHSLYKGEQLLCLQCLHQLPYTHFHQHQDNPVERMLWGRCTVGAATSLLFFKKSTRVQQIMHQIKYNGKQELGVKMGHLLGTALLDNERFKGIDSIVPVPLHPDKYQKRGYNQSECFAKGIAETMALDMLTTQLIRSKASETQTRKNRYQRYLNTEEVFQLQEPEQLYGKHVLLVDDVITTGATIEACVHALTEVDVKVSVASIAYAK